MPLKPKLKPLRDLTQFIDIKEILDTALRHESWPVNYVLETPGAAISWRTRAHRYRKALQFNEEQRHTLHTGAGTSEYDNLILRIPKETPNVVNIDLRKPTGYLEIEGKEVETFPDEVEENFDQPFLRTEK